MLAILMRSALFVALAVGAGLAGVVWMPSLSFNHKQSHEQPLHVPEDTEEKVQRAGNGRLLVPSVVAQKMGLQTGQAREATRPRALAPFQGVLALMPDGLGRARSRFAGEVVELGKAKLGDQVKKGDLLAIVWSKDLGEKKSELADALARLKTDEATLRRLEALYKENATAERSVREAQKVVEQDRIAANRAERTLRAWRLTPTEIAAAHAPIHKAGKDWARVEVKAPRSGTILETNIANGDIIETTTDLFKIGDLTTLSFWAHVYEEDLPLLASLPREAPCRVALPSMPGADFPSTLDRIGAVIDPNLHTALVTGKVNNPGGKLKVGQYVTVTVELPAARGELEVPAEAVVEDGSNSVVFVPEPGGVFRCVPVKVLRRFHDAIFIKAEKDGLQAGQTVATRGSLLLKAALDTLPDSR